MMPDARHETRDARPGERHEASFLSLSDIHFSYGAREVLCALSLDVARGESLGILGPNGAGKSTLLRCIAGLLRPSRGTVALEGSAIPKMAARARARRIAFVPQHFELPFAFTAMEIVLSGRAPHLSPFGFESARDVAIAREAMELTDCAAFAARSIQTLSGGERQRVVLARAIAQEPELLLLDEPTAFLDLRHQLDLHRLLRRLGEERGCAVIAAMHDVNLAAAFCDRIALLAEGRIAALGTPLEVVRETVIRAAFGADIVVERSTITGNPYCIPG